MIFRRVLYPFCPNLIVLFEGCKFVKLDIRAKKLVKTVENFSPDVINHHAAQIDVRKSVSDPVFNAEVNELGTLNLLNAAVAAKVKKIIFSSTGGAIYGEVKPNDGADENHPQEPISPYAITKRAVELYLYAYKVNHGLDFKPETRGLIV